MRSLFLLVAAVFLSANAAAADARAAGAEQCKMGETLGFRERMIACNEAVALLSARSVHIDALMQRAALLMSVGDWSRAIVDYSEVVKLDPRHGSGHVGLADARAGNGDLPGAVTEYGRAIALEPGNAGYWARRCWMQARLGRDLDAALDDCQRALALQPDGEHLMGARGFVYLVRKDYAAAIADYDAELRLVPPDAYAFFGRGLAKMRLGASGPGRADLATAAAIDPTVAAAFASWGFRP